MKIDIKEGARLAAYIALLNLAIVSVTYVSACRKYTLGECSMMHGIDWTLKHPIFPEIMPWVVLMAFLVGIFCGSQPKR